MRRFFKCKRRTKRQQIVELTNTVNTLEEEIIGKNKEIERLTEENLRLDKENEQAEEKLAKFWRPRGEKGRFTSANEEDTAIKEEVLPEENQ